MSSGLFSRLQKGLSKTRAALTLPVSALLSGGGKPDEKTLAELEEVLLTADMSYNIVDVTIKKLRDTQPSELKEKYNPKLVLKDILVKQLSSSHGETTPVKNILKPHIIMLVGVNGSGKTTTIGKLAAYYRSLNKSVILAAADTFRDAAIEQLQVWGDRSNFRVIKHRQGSDSSAVIFDALKAAKAGNSDYLLIDTAGRLHTKYNLMMELAKMGRVISREVPDAPHEVFLVLDGNTGQNGIVQAEEFLKSVKVTGLIVTKLDGTSRAGFIFGIKEKTNLDVKFIGIGEKIDDLIPFDPEQFVDALLL